MTVVKASISLRGSKDSYSSIAFVDTGARMTLVDRLLAERIGVVYTGRVLSLISISGHILKALEAVVPELEVEGEVLKYEAIAVSDIPEDVKKVLKESNLDENIVIGLLTIERASMVPDTTAETLRKVESFII